jgi:hypothetical protein
MKALGKHALKSQSESRLNAMINLAKSEPGIAAAPDALTPTLAAERAQRDCQPAYRQVQGPSTRGPSNQDRARCI